MLIQWFPGHMTKALRAMEKDIKLVDLVIYVLDARAPYSSVNPEFARVIGNKPIIYVLNKADLANQAQTAQWIDFFTGKTSVCIALDSTQTNSTKIITSNIEKLVKERFAKFDSKGITMVKRAMILGVPNSGKSTLINNLCGRYKAKTGDKPGVTKGTQWVRVGEILELLDTPGTLWPSFQNQDIAKNLAFIGSIRDEVVDQTELALDFLDKIRAEYPDNLTARYGIDLDGQPVELLERICQARKFVMRGNEPDYERGARAVLDDFRKGRLGRITLDQRENYA